MLWTPGFSTDSAFMEVELVIFNPCLGQYRDTRRDRIPVWPSRCFACDCKTWQVHVILDFEVSQQNKTDHARGSLENRHDTHCQASSPPGDTSPDYPGYVHTKALATMSSYLRLSVFAALHPNSLLQETFKGPLRVASCRHGSARDR